MNAQEAMAMIEKTRTDRLQREQQERMKREQREVVFLRDYLAEAVRKERLKVDVLIENAIQKEETSCVHTVGDQQQYYGHVAKNLQKALEQDGFRVRDQNRSCTYRPSDESPEETTYYVELTIHFLPMNAWERCVAEQ